ncbi:MAG: hypothetical protein ACK55Z_37140, partial [bacterium]
MKIEKRLHDLLHLKRTKLKQLYVWYCTNELYIQLYVCLHSFLRMIYIKGGRHKTKNKTKDFIVRILGGLKREIIVRRFSPTRILTMKS